MEFRESLLWDVDPRSIDEDTHATYIKVSFIAYPFFIPKEHFHEIGSVRMLDIDDIAVMKIVAIRQHAS
jgi:hypothetical protein